MCESVYVEWIVGDVCVSVCVLCECVHVYTCACGWVGTQLMQPSNHQKQLLNAWELKP